jgi:hypothetical protein
MKTDEPISAATTSSTTWADLFLGLLYAGSILLFLTWISGWELGQAPESLKSLEKIAGQGWSWAISAASGAVVSLIFYRRISNWVLVWTIVLTMGLGVTAYLLRMPRPLAPEHWQTTEANGLFSNSWDVKYDGSSFPCAPSPGFNGGLCRASAWGSMRAVERYQPADNNPCSFFGSVTGDTVSGEYYCRIGGTYKWSARIIR